MTDTKLTMSCYITSEDSINTSPSARSQHQELKQLVKLYVGKTELMLKGRVIYLETLAKILTTPSVKGIHPPNLSVSSLPLGVELHM